MRRISGIVLLVVGLVLVAAAGVIRWAVSPAVITLPSDTNTTRVYTGTASAVMNPTLLTGTLYGSAVLRDQPANVVNQVKVVSTKGGSALVTNRKLVGIPGHTVADYTWRYGVDRKNLGRGGSFSNVTKQTGVTFNWPIDTKKHDYTGWVSDIQSSTPLHYAGTAKRGGITTYVFTANVPTERIADPTELKGLPASMSKADLMRIAPSLGLTLDQLKQMDSTLQKLPDPVPFGYTFSATSTYWVAPDSGVVVDVRSHEVRSAAFAMGSLLVPVGPVLDLTYTSTQATLKAAADDAKDKASQMTLIRTTLPSIAAGGGIVLLLIAIALVATGRRRTPPTPVFTPERELTPTG